MPTSQPAWLEFQSDDEVTSWAVSTLESRP